MKTPDEIKKGLWCCSADCEWDNGCPYMGLFSECTEGLKSDALAYIQQLEAQAPKWISVEERLPGKYLRVLGACCMGVFETMYDGKYWRIDELPFENTITHWMPLPEPPKEDDHV